MLRKLVERIRGSKGEEEEKEVYYVLKRMTERGGWTKVFEMSSPVNPDEIYRHLEPGMYRLDKYIRGGSKFEVVWGPIHVYGNTPTEGDVEVVDTGRRRRRSSAGEDIFSFVEELEKYSEKLDKLAEVGIKLARLGGKSVVEIPEGKTAEDIMVDMLDQLRNRWEKLDQLFGKSRVRGEEAEIPIDGKIPAWMVYAPQLMERMMDNVERRLRNWGVIGDIGEGSESKVDVPEFPRIV